jgi:hypothetical protein
MSWEYLNPWYSHCENLQCHNLHNSVNVKASLYMNETVYISPEVIRACLHPEDIT